MKRNWMEINRVADPNTRLAVSLAKDPEILACFERGFPHLFVEGDDAGPLCVPLSVLMEAAEEKSKMDWPNDPHVWEWDRHFSLGFAFYGNRHLDIPVTFRWSDGVPLEVRQQLVGQKVSAAMRITYCDKKYLVLNIDFVQDLVIGSVIVDPPELNSLEVVPAECVNVDA